MSTAEYPDDLTRRIAQLAAASVEDPDGEGSAVAMLVGGLRSDIDAVRADLDGLGGRLDELPTRLATLETGVGALAEQIRADALGNVELRRELLAALREAQVQAATDRTAVAQRLADLARDTADSSAATRETVDRLTALAGRLAGLDATVARGVVADERSVTVLSEVATSTEALNKTIAGFRAEWPTRTFEVVQGARAVAEGVVAEVRKEVSAQLVRVREELARAVESVVDASSGISSGTDRLSGVGSVLVAYLEERDRLLEAERDRVLHEVLDTFASGLSARERTALSGRVTDAVARRRDARDADRYRCAVGAPVPPVLDLPAAVRELVPAPAADRTAERAPARALVAEPPGPAPVQGSAVPSAPSLPGRTRPAPAAAVARRPPAAARAAGSARERVAPRPGSGTPATDRPALSAPRSTVDAAAPGKGAGSERRARVEAMPEARSPALALEAAAPGPRPPAAEAPDPG